MSKETSKVVELKPQPKPVDPRIKNFPFKKFQKRNRNRINAQEQDNVTITLVIICPCNFIKPY